MMRLFGASKSDRAKHQAARPHRLSTSATCVMNIPTRRCPRGWTPQGWLTRTGPSTRSDALPPGRAGEGPGPAGPGTRLDRETRLRALFPDHPPDRRVCRQPGHPLPGQGLGRQFAVCYVLGITAVDPNENDVLFARFISRGTREPPDIDVDFEHERREEVIQWIYKTLWPRARRHRRDRDPYAAAQRDPRCRQGAGPDRGRHAQGLPTRNGAAGARSGQSCPSGRARSDKPDHPSGVGFAIRLLGFPRHLSQHVGGFVLARGRLDEIGADRQCRDGRPHLHRMGQGRHRRAAIDEGRCAGAGHADLHPKAFDLLREHESIDWELADVPTKTKRPTTCFARESRSASSRSRAGRR
jgi:error-prone DNA polymerase